MKGVIFFDRSTPKVFDAEKKNMGKCVYQVNLP